MARCHSGRTTARVLLLGRLREAIARLNPGIPTAAAGRRRSRCKTWGCPQPRGQPGVSHKLLVGGVPVQYQQGGETRGDFVRLVDWADATSNGSGNEFWAVNQFTLKGPHHTRRPDIVVVRQRSAAGAAGAENPVDQEASIWKAYDQIQTYKEQIPTCFSSTRCW